MISAFCLLCLKKEHFLLARYCSAIQNLCENIRKIQYSLTKHHAIAEILLINFYLNDLKSTKVEYNLRKLRRKI